ncbi:Ribosomal large subunit pseudouridine synthase B [Methylobacterium bullatum]|uniref:Pseudouridine synthase n=1 Tax=Methylobacterium bullatum TaxID=570505 RepID=A0A679JED7_9HYPH|nr:Ribosomal large subunit pseudouridine synthase B [Methylobacterium bullatum]
MSDKTDEQTGGSEDAPETNNVSGEAWSPATDAGVPGPSAEEQPAPRRAAPARGGDAPLRRKAALPRPAAKAAEAGAAGDSEAATPEGDRIAKAIARAGIASRRDVEAMIAEGRVTLNGKVLTSPAINVTDADEITVDGEPLPARERTRLWIYHKPRGLVTTARDPEGRQTVFEALPEDLPRVVAIGRLDINTEGLLLLTNDGGLAKVIAHPDTGWLRRYRVRAHGDTTQAELDKLRKGVTIDGMDYGPVDAVLDRASGDNLWLTLGLREGKNREVKRILEHLGLAVNRLIRLSFGPFQLGDLEVGLVEEIRTKVLKEQLGPTLADQAGVDFTSPNREPIAPFGSPKAAQQQTKQPARSASAAAARSAGRSYDDAPRGGERGGDRPLRRPAEPARVPTGGNSAGPRRSVWRAEDAAPQEDGARRVKIPRRGADPKAEREASAARGRERVGAINTGERRVLVERLKASPQEPAPEPHRRDRGARRDDTGAAERPVRTLRQSDAKAARREEADARPPRSDSRPPRRDDAPRGGFGRPDGAERRGPPRGGDERPRSFKPRDGGGFNDRAERPAFNRGEPRGDRPAGFRSEKPAFNRGGDDRPGGGRPGGFKPGGFKGAGFKGRSDDRQGGDRDIGAERSGADRGGFRPGGKPGGFGKPGGSGRPAGAGRPGGFKAGGSSRPGGSAKPGGFGNRGGGAGGKPGGGGGRPPRGGSR